MFRSHERHKSIRIPYVGAADVAALPEIEGQIIQCFPCDGAALLCVLSLSKGASPVTVTDSVVPPTCRITSIRAAWARRFGFPVGQTC